MRAFYPQIRHFQALKGKIESGINMRCGACSRCACTACDSCRCTPCKRNMDEGGQAVITRRAKEEIVVRRERKGYYKLSKFSHFVESCSGLVAIYNALSLGVIIVDWGTAGRLKMHATEKIGADLLGKILGDDEELFEEILAQKILVPIEENMDMLDYLLARSELEKDGIGVLYLMLSDRCNFACDYCFVENAIPSGYHFSNMGMETAKRGIDRFADLLSRSQGFVEPQIILYGGEPLLNPETLVGSLLYIEEMKIKGMLPQNTAITLNTNGTLLSRNESVVQALKKVVNLDVAISLDGPEDIHNAGRHYHDGDGTFRDVLAGYEKLKRNGIESGFCCTITKHNLDHLEEIARWFVEQMDVRSIGFNILIENSSGPDASLSDSYAQNVSRKIINCFQYFRQHGIYEDRIMRKVNAFADGYIYYHDCAGYGEQIVVSPDGLIGLCPGHCGRRQNFFQDKDDFDPLSHPTWREWRKRSPLNMEQCLDCIALAICGGGCAYSAEARHGTIWSLDDIFCTHAKATTRFLIEDLMVQFS